MKKNNQILPLVSIIVPTFNRLNMFSECLQSIANQTFKDFEIIVINDAGKDVGDVIKRCNNFLDISYLCHDKNKGRRAARNTGLKAAKGKYIAYLDDDDLFYPDHLETLVTFLEKSHFKVAYTDAYQVTQELTGETYKTLLKELLYSEDFDKDRFLVENYIPVICFMHERLCLEKAGIFEESERLHEDWDLWIRMSRIYDFYHIKKVTSEYRIRNDNMTSVTKNQHLDDFRYIYSKYSHLTKDKPQIRKCQRLRLMEKEAANTQQEGDYNLAIEKYREIIILSPQYILAHYNLGSIYQKIGKRKEAEEEFKIVLKLINGRSNLAGGCHFHLGKIYQMAGEMNKARNEFERCLSIVPDHKKAREYLEAS